MFNQFILAARAAYLSGNVQMLTNIMNNLIDWISDGEGVTQSELETLSNYVKYPLD